MVRYHHQVIRMYRPVRCWQSGKRLMRLRLAYDRVGNYRLYLTTQHFLAQERRLTTEYACGELHLTWDELPALVQTPDLRLLTRAGFPYRNKPAVGERIPPWLAYARAMMISWVIANPDGFWVMLMLAVNRGLAVCYAPQFFSDLRSLFQASLLHDAAWPLAPEHLGFASAEDVWSAFCDDPASLATLALLHRG